MQPARTDRKKSKALFAGGIAALFCLTAAAIDREELEVDHALTFEFKTPHTPWARPYAHGRTRVLFFTNGRGTTPRECVELMERFDLDARAVFWARIIDSTKEHWHGGELGRQRMLELLGRKWDCYVFVGMDLTRMSPEAQYKVLKPVTEGAGIVFVGRPDKRIFKPANRFQPLPDFLRREKPGSAYRVGRGRGVALPSQPNIPYQEGWNVLYDYWAERVGRAILWAAGKDPAVTLRLECGPSSRPREDRTPFRVTAAGTPRGRNLELWARLRRPGGPVLTFDPRPVRIGEQAAFTPENLPAGRWFFDVRVRSERGVEAWDYREFRIVSPRTVKAVELNPDWSEVGGRLAGRVLLSGHAFPAETVRVRCMDRRRRVLMQRDYRPDGDAVTFGFPVAEWLPMLVTVEAQVLDADGKEAARGYAYFHVTKRNRGRFNFLIWDVPHGALAPYAEEMLARTGVTLQLRGGNPPLYVAAFDIAWVPYTTRILARHDADGVMKPYCWNDEQAVQKDIAARVQRHMGARQHGVFVWSLGDEVSTKGCCLSPYCGEAYRRFLREQYRTLEALNASWGTDFKTWADVGLSDPKDNDENGSLRSGNYPRWFDRQAFKAWNFVQLCRRFRAAYEKIDPEAKVGFEGAGRFDRGDDIDLIIRNNTFWSPYPGTVDEVIRSIAPREFPRANWMGYTKDADSLLAKYWRMVTRGMDAVWWWRWDAIGRFHGWLAPDLRPYPAVKEILRDTQFLREGLGDLLLRSEMQDDGIAVLYSFPSSMAQRLDDGKTFGGYEGAHKAVHRAVRELGLQFRYVTARMLRNGETDLGRFRVLFLPRTEALSEKSARVIRRFVERGGTVIADVRVGVFDEHCKPRNAGILDDLFGIRRTARTARGKAVNVKSEAFGDTALHVDAGIEPVSGTPGLTLDGHPLFITRRKGRGMAILLGFSFDTWPNLALPETDEAHAERLRAWLERAGVRPRPAVRSGKGTRERNLEVIRWKTGDIEIVSLFRESGTPSEATVLLPEPRYVVDLRNGTSPGRVQRFPVHIRPCRASFFALLPAAPASLRVQAPAECSRGRVMNVAVQVPDARGLHAARLRVYTGDRHLEWFDRNIVVGRSPVTARLPVAFNDPTGTWRIELKDAYRKQTTSVIVKVQ